MSNIDEVSREQKVIEFWLLTTKLKNTIRSGWLKWNVSRERLESVAEHVYGTQMLAIAIYSEFQDRYQNLDIMKVLYMIAIHEVGETIIGDKTQFDIPKELKREIELSAVKAVFSPLAMGPRLLELYAEFEGITVDGKELEKMSDEAIFAKHCDHLECDLQSKVYDQEGLIDVFNQKGNNAAKNELVVELLKKHNNSFSKMWLEFGQVVYGYTDDIVSISKHAMYHRLQIPEFELKHREFIRKKVA